MIQAKHEISELLTLLAATEYLYKQGTADHVPLDQRYYHPEGRHIGPRKGRFSIIGVEIDPHGNPLGQLVPALAPGMENESVRAWIERDPEAQHVLNTLSQYGDPYVVGGGVRDALLGVPSKDVDIEVYGLTIDELSDIVQKDFGGKQDQVGKVYGVFKVGNFDISLPRTETKVGEKHTDFDVEPNPDLPPELAARRRDFTINALMYDYKNDQVLDFFGGIQDLEAKRIKHVSPETFVEDPLRVYRAAQFAARFDFSIDPSTIELARSMDLSEISNERVFGEFEKLLLKSSTPSTGMQALDDMGVLDAQFPEISALKNTHQRSDFHAEGDVFTHTKMTLDKAAEIIQRFPDQKDKTIIMLAALCHDLGKATTTTPDGRAIGHEAAGVPITEEFLGKLTNDRDILATVPSLVENHLRPLQFHRDGASDAAFRRLINKHGTEYLNLLSAVSEADVSGRLIGYPDGSVGEPGTEENVWFRDRVQQVSEKAGGLKGGKIVPLITGNDLKDLGFKEGKELGSILRDVQKRQEEGEITSADEALDFVRTTYKSEESDQHLSKQGSFPTQEWITGFVPPEKRFYHLEGTHKGPRGGQFSIIGTEVDQHGASLQQASQAQPPGPHDISELPMPPQQTEETEIAPAGKEARPQRPYDLREGQAKRQETERKLQEQFKSLNLISHKDIATSGAKNIVSYEDASSIAEQSGFVDRMKGWDEFGIDRKAREGQEEFAALVNDVEKHETITVWHGTNLANAQGIIETGKIYGDKAFGGGVTLSPLEARGYAGGGRVGVEGRKADNVQVILQIELPADQFKDFTPDPQKDNSFTYKLVHIPVPIDSSKIKLVFDDEGRLDHELKLLGESYGGVSKDLLDALQNTEQATEQPQQAEEEPSSDRQPASVYEKLSALQEQSGVMVSSTIDENIEKWNTAVGRDKRSFPTFDREWFSNALSTSTGIKTEIQKINFITQMDGGLRLHALVSFTDTKTPPKKSESLPSAGSSVAEINMALEAMAGRQSGNVGVFSFDIQQYHQDAPLTIESVEEFEGEDREGGLALEAYYSYAHLGDDYQGKGIVPDVTENLEKQLREKGVKRITLIADEDVGGYAWAAQGYDFSQDTDTQNEVSKMYWGLQKSIKNAAYADDKNQRYTGEVSDQDKEKALQQLEDLIERDKGWNIRSWDLASFDPFSDLEDKDGGVAPRKMGKLAMLGTQWMGVKSLDESSISNIVGKRYYDNKKKK